MTKKNYKAFANLFNSYLITVETEIEKDCLSDFIKDFSFLLSIDNPKFDPLKFRNACYKDIS